MKSYAGWKEEQKRSQFYKESLDDNANEVKAAFDELRDTIKRVSESAGLFGSVKRGILGATKATASSLFGKNSRAASAIPDVSSNYDLHRTNALGTLGRAAIGGAQDTASRIGDEITGAAARRRRHEDTDNEGNLYLEWDKNALEVIMAKIDEVEKKITSHIKTLTNSNSSSIHAGDNSWETAKPSRNSFSTHSGIPAGIAHTLQTELPPETLNKMEDRFETDPILQKFLIALGKKAPFTAINQIASELGQTPENIAEELDAKYDAKGTLKDILLKRRPVAGKIIDHLKGYGHKIVTPTGEKISTAHTLTSGQ